MRQIGEITSVFWKVKYFAVGAIRWRSCPFSGYSKLVTVHVVSPVSDCSRILVRSFSERPRGAYQPGSKSQETRVNSPEGRVTSSSIFTNKGVTIMDISDSPGSGKEVEAKEVVQGNEDVLAVDREDEPETENPDEVADISIAEVAIELDDNLKSKLVADLSSICSIDQTTAREMLEVHKWNMQRAIDTFFDGSDGNDDSTDSVEILTSPPPQPPEIVDLDDVVSPGSDCKKEKNTEIEKSGSSSEAENSFSSWAPEKISVISWNLDGLDDKNLEKRTDAVIELILKENHDVVFFQELLPFTFDYIARRICSKYMPIPGTDNPACEYLTGTFLKLNHVHYEDHYIVPFPNTVMQRNLLVTKVFVGQAKIALLNTHLESTKDFSKQRTEQLKTCFELAQSFPPEYNVLFGGDLNLRDSEVTGLLPASMCDVWIRCGSRKSCEYTWDLTRNTNKQMPQRFQPRCRFDRFYFRSSTPSTLEPEFFGVTGIEKAFGTQSFPSDHWAIITFLRLSKEARKPSSRKRKSSGEAAS